MIHLTAWIKMILFRISGEIELFNHKNLLILLIIFQTISSCKTDVDVNAPYKETTVVYGLLNANDSVHFIKINKTFLGKESAYVMATNKDSSEYNNPYSPKMTASIEELKSGTATRTWILKDTVVKNKESGSFYYPEQTLYYFAADPKNPQTKLDSSAQYRLLVNINNGEKTVSAKTSIISDASFNANGMEQVKIGFMSNFSDGIYNNNLSYKWISIKNGKRYQLKLVVVYENYYTDGTTEKKSMEWNFQPPLQSDNTSGGQSMSIPVKGEDFYKELKKQLEPLTTDKISKRKFIEMYFILSVAGDDLNTYLLANEPSTGIIQEKPEFTNIQNGVGIFSSRIALNSHNKELTDESLRELAEGKYTYSLKFCTTINGTKYGTCPP